jgi:glycosyltransferase involved in cell wall biosynthesis
MEKKAEKPPLFSVVIDNYNYGCYLEEAIDSVLNQTFPQNEIEIIVVDDGSTDDSSERLKKYRGKVTCIFKKNGGQASALNVGIANAKGAIISFLDADDYWHPMKLQCVFEEFQGSQALAFVYHYMDVVNNQREMIDRYIFPSPLSEKGARSGERYLQRYLKGVLPFFSPTSGMTVRADCLKNAVPIPEEFRIAADIYLHYILPFYAKELSLIKKPLGYYRMHGGNLYGSNVLTAEKVKREMRTMSLVGPHVAEHSRRLAYDDHLIRLRLESVGEIYKIFLHNFQGEKIKAMRMALCFNKFLPGDAMSYKLTRKMISFISAFIPSSLHIWLQRRYRSLLYWVQHDHGWDKT